MKGNQWYFGLKAHIGVDSKEGVVHSVCTSAASVADKHMLPDLLHGEERKVWGDGGYQGQTEAIHEAAPHAQDMTCRRTKFKNYVDEEAKRKNTTMSKVRAKVEALVHGQRRLFGDVSHELLSPLARLSVAEGLLRQCPSEERAEYLDRIASEVEHLDQLIGQLLTLARIDSGADSSRTEKVELSSLIQVIAVDGNFKAKAKSCAVKLDSMDVCTTTGAREQLRRAIENVVRNAIRPYTAQHRRGNHDV